MIILFDVTKLQRLPNTLTPDGNSVTAYDTECTSADDEKRLVVVHSSAHKPLLVALDIKSNRLSRFALRDFSKPGSFTRQAFGVAEVYASMLMSVDPTVTPEKLSASIQNSILRSEYAFRSAYGQAWGKNVNQAAHDQFRAGLFGGKPMVEELVRIRQLIDEQYPVPLAEWRDALDRWEQAWQSGDPFTEERSDGFPMYMAWVITTIHAFTKPA